MLFNSIEFIFFYLPVVYGIYRFLIRRECDFYARCWLGGMSLFFYAWWNWHFLPVLVVSILFNYGISNAVMRSQQAGMPTRAKAWLGFGIAMNLVYLGWFKYALFFATTLHTALGTAVPQFLSQIVLPLGISFFTFTQIAFLVDTWEDHSERPPFTSYLLFVTYFPHLIAGPIMHHKEMMPQFNSLLQRLPNLENLGIGLSIFTIGLAKKMLIADSVASYSDRVFAAAVGPAQISFFEGWCAALSYTVQIYFDFSGYSDMAIGLSYMLGIQLPFNFNSPYKAGSIIDFWRRWHISLSRFLRDYLYIRLGGNRKGAFRRFLNLLTTMLLGGLWHGAGWTFVIWGGLHGTYLIINHLWRSYIPKANQSITRKLLSGALTFMAVVIAWIFFRAPDVDVALNILSSMYGANGFDLPIRVGAWLKTSPTSLVRFDGISPNGLIDNWAFLEVAIALLITWTMPNIQQIFKHQQIGLGIVDYIRGWAMRLIWRPNLAWAAGLGGIAAFALFYTRGTNQFLYFNF